MQPYQTYREYFRDVLIAIGLFLVAAEFAAWTTPVLRRVLDFSAMYAVAFAIGMIPFWLFARRAGAIDIDVADFIGLLIVSVICASILSLRPKLAGMDVPDFVVVYGAWLVCFTCYSALRHWLVTRNPPDDVKER